MNVEFSKEDKEFIAYVKEGYQEKARQVKIINDDELLNDLFELSTFMSMMKKYIDDEDMRGFIFSEDDGPWSEYCLNEIVELIDLNDMDSKRGDE